MSEYQDKFDGYKFSFHRTSSKIFDPRNEIVEVRLTTRKGEEYSANFVARGFVNYIFKKNRRTGERAGGTYFCMPNMILVGEISEQSVRATIDDLIKNLEIEGFSIAYKRFKEDFSMAHERFKAYEFSINLDDRESYNSLSDVVEVRLTTKDGQEYLADFVTVGFIDYIFKKNRRTGECAGGTYFCMPNMILVGEISEQSVRATIDDLIKNLEIYKYFKNIEEFI